MIEIREVGEEYIADTGLEKYHYCSWEELLDYILEIKNYPSEKVYLREGSRLERIRI